MGLWDLLTGSGNPTRQWPRSDEPLPVVRLNPFKLGTLRLGEEIESVRFLGRPDHFMGKAKRGNMMLTHTNRGLQLSFEEHRLVQITFHLAGDTFWSLEDGAPPARLRFEDGTKLDEASTIDDVKRRFGEPDEVDEDEDETTLTYRDGQAYLSFEFNDAGVLGAFVAALDV